MKKLLGVSASTRIWGNCESATKAVLASACEAGAASDFIRLTDFSIESCRGCFTCVAGDARCPIDDDLYTFFSHIHDVDAVVMASPVYFMSPPAQVMALLDRLLTMGRPGRVDVKGKPAVTLTIMGNRKWQGVTEPLVNMTASLLGLEIVESMNLVAEGPGEIMTSDAVTGQLAKIGKALALGEPVAVSERREVCPVCRSDFFKIEAPHLVCPICGSAGDLEKYLKDGEFICVGGEVRWGLSWLDRHIASWVAPSVDRYKTKRKTILKNLRSLKERYTAREERAGNDMQ